MSKRFIDTNIFSDEWFSDLSVNGKLFFVFFITNCDHAGILRLNKKLTEFQLGIKNIETLIKELGNTLIFLKEGVYLMPKFLRFQYPGFPSSNVRQQNGALNILSEYGITIDKLNSYLTVSKDLTKSYVYDNDTEHDTGKGVKGEKENTPIPTEIEFLNYCKELIPEKYQSLEFSIKAKYKQWVENNWKDGYNKPIKKWKSKIQNTIPHLKPMYESKREDYDRPLAPIAK